MILKPWKLAFIEANTSTKNFPTALHAMVMRLERFADFRLESR